MNNLDVTSWSEYDKLTRTLLDESPSKAGDLVLAFLNEHASPTIPAPEKKKSSSSKKQRKQASVPTKPITRSPSPPVTTRAIAKATPPPTQERARSAPPELLGSRLSSLATVPTPDQSSRRVKFQLHGFGSPQGLGPRTPPGTGKKKRDSRLTASPHVMSMPSPPKHSPNDPVIVRPHAWTPPAQPKPQPAEKKPSPLLRSPPKRRSPPAAVPVQQPALSIRPTTSSMVTDPAGMARGYSYTMSPEYRQALEGRVAQQRADRVSSPGSPAVRGMPSPSPAQQQREAPPTPTAIPMPRSPPCVRVTPRTEPRTPPSPSPKQPSSAMEVPLQAVTDFDRMKAALHWWNLQTRCRVFERFWAQDRIQPWFASVRARNKAIRTIAARRDRVRFQAALRAWQTHVAASRRQRAAVQSFEARATHRLQALALARWAQTVALIQLRHRSVSRVRSRRVSLAFAVWVDSARGRQLSRAVAVAVLDRAIANVPRAPVGGWWRHTLSAGIGRRHLQAWHAVVVANAADEASTGAKAARMFRSWRMVTAEGRRKAVLARIGRRYASTAGMRPAFAHWREAWAIAAVRRRRDRHLLAAGFQQWSQEVQNQDAVDILDPAAFEPRPATPTSGISDSAIAQAVTPQPAQPARAPAPAVFVTHPVIQPAPADTDDEITVRRGPAEQPVPRPEPSAVTVGPESDISFSSASSSDDTFLLSMLADMGTPSPTLPTSPPVRETAPELPKPPGYAKSTEHPPRDVVQPTGRAVEVPLPKPTVIKVDPAPAPRPARPPLLSETTDFTSKPARPAGQPKVETIEGFVQVKPREMPRIAPEPQGVAHFTPTRSHAPAPKEEVIVPEPRRIDRVVAQTTAGTQTESSLCADPAPPVSQPMVCPTTMPSPWTAVTLPTLSLRHVNRREDFPITQGVLAAYRQARQSRSVTSVASTAEQLGLTITRRLCS
ncbi:hypothetical protein J8273_0361 [Carpediemonas membranifera]|uniref:Sfi1 spindle body domain-containing protein n=1 Tax=Carpediemonas membranifera TaxID=201153 RepID=A0A8J6BDC9_9EUKA|nr:hypothetical protein J8273_0361 [Carpediemonas membranifera]|eukprot:KAG9395142.1 hypothetical protein J8273_0361 [Carpediemonas membranifera]